MALSQQTAFESPKANSGANLLAMLFSANNTAQPTTNGKQQTPSKRAQPLNCSFEQQTLNQKPPHVAQRRHQSTGHPSKLNVNGKNESNNSSRSNGRSPHGPKQAHDCYSSPQKQQQPLKTPRPSPNVDQSDVQRLLASLLNSNISSDSSQPSTFSPLNKKSGDHTQSSATNALFETSKSNSTINRSVTTPVDQLIPKTTTDGTNEENIELRDLVTWHDEDEEPLDERFYMELADPSLIAGWNPSEMFKYNEKMHKISSSYDEKTYSNHYSTPLSKSTSKTTMKKASQLAQEIEKRVIDEGRVTPESSDDDEAFEADRKSREMQVNHVRQLHQLNQLRLIQRQKNLKLAVNNQLDVFTNEDNVPKQLKTKPSYNNKTSPPRPTTGQVTATPAENMSMGEQPSRFNHLGHNNIKSVTSSSRNILRSCLV